MRLLIITQKVDAHDDNLGFFHRWIEEFSKQCESVIVICLYEGVHSFSDNVRVLSLGKENGASRIKYLRRFFSYIWKERKNYDAVFVHMNQIYAILGGVLWRLLGKPIGLWYAHGSVSPSLRLATWIVNTIFTSTKEGFRIGTKKTHIIGQGIDTSLFSFKQKYEIAGPVRFLAIGRITPVKKLETLLEMLVLLHSRGIHATLDIIGSVDVDSKEYGEELQAKVRQNGLDTSVRFLGGMPYKSLGTLLPTYDIFVSAGATGSLDKTLLDAAAAGLPVVTSSAVFRSVAPEEAHEGICEPNAEGFAVAVERLVASSVEHRAEIGRALRSFVEREQGLSPLIMKILAIIEDEYHHVRD